ncbi:MAG: TonB-dependent receptor [Bacteroidales bacterium]|nr:TonB-dependent receptor [Bacteroidales bacterium]
MKYLHQHNNIEIHFRKWSRKKHGVFTSLKKEIKICTLLVTYTILTYKGPVAAQSDTIILPLKIDVEEVEVIGQRAPGIYPNVARVISVIPYAELSSAPARSPADLLEFLPGTDIRQRGNFGVQADLGMRGGSFDQALVLINGIPFNDPQTGHHNLNLPIPYNAINKIEILEGPGSRVYGANAFSGAVNIITGMTEEDQLGLLITAGQHGFYSAATTLGYKSGKLSSFISVSGRGSVGYADNTDFYDYSGYYKADYKLSSGIFELQAGYSKKAFGANSFYTARYPEQYEQVKSKFFALKFNLDKKIKSKYYIAWRRHNDRFELFREDRYRFLNGFFVNGHDTAVYIPGIYEDHNYYSGHNYHLSDVVAAGVNITLNTRAGSSSFGMEYKYDRILSNVLGNELKRVIEVRGEARGVFSRGDSRDVFNFFAEHVIKLKTFYLSGGALCFVHNFNTMNVFTGAEAGKRFGAHGRLFVSVNQSLRMPTYTDLYYNGPSNTGNPGLKPEKAVTMEGGYKLNLPAVSIQATVFHRAGNDIIDWVKAPGEAKYTTMNHTGLNTSGIQLSAGYNNRNNVSRVNWLKYYYLDYSYLSTDKNSNEYISAYALDYLKHKFTARFSHKVYKSLEMTWNLTWQDRNGTFTDKDMSEQAYKPFFLLNARFQLNLKDGEAYLEGSNLLNAKYRDFGSVVQPGVWIFAGVNMHLNLHGLK